MDALGPAEFRQGTTVTFTNNGTEDSSFYGDITNQQKANIIFQPSNTETNFLNTVTSMTGTLVSTIKDMTTFNFHVAGAPAAINIFLSGILGIISLIFWTYLVREVLGLVPLVG